MRGSQSVGKLGQHVQRVASAAALGKSSAAVWVVVHLSVLGGCCRRTRAAAMILGIARAKPCDGDLKSWIPVLGLVRHDSRSLARVMGRTLTNRSQKASIHPFSYSQQGETRLLDDGKGLESALPPLRRYRLVRLTIDSNPCMTFC